MLQCQEQASKKLLRFLQACARDDAHAKARAQPDVSFLYGPASVGKTYAALCCAFVLTLCGSRKLPKRALIEPEAYLDALEREEDGANTILLLHCNVDKRKTASVIRIIVAFFDRLAQQLELGLDLPACVAIIFDELDKASAAFLEVLLTLFERGYLMDSWTKPKSPRRVHSPRPLVILSTGNSPPHSVLRREQPLTDKALREEANGVLGSEAVTSRMAKWLVHFYPYSSAQLSQIMKSCQKRLLRHVISAKCCRQTSRKQWSLSDKFRAWAREQFRVHAGVIRSWYGTLSVELRAAICVAQDQSQMDTWEAVRLTVKDKHVLARRERRVLASSTQVC